MSKSRVTEGTSINVWNAMSKAVEGSSVDTISTFIGFFRDVLRDSLEYKKIDPFREYINFPSRIYSQIVFQRRKNIAAQVLVDQIADQLSLHLKEIIAYYIVFASKSEKNTEAKAEIDVFFYEGFNAFNDFLFRQVMQQDWKLLKSSLTRYSQIGDEVYNGTSLDELKLKNLNEANIDGIDSDEIVSLRTQIKYREAFLRYRRQPLAALKYWVFLLFDNGKITEETVLELLKGFARQFYDANKEIDDLLFFRTGDLQQYMGWENWDYIERPENELYYPPMPSQWMTSGFVIDRIRNNNAYFNSEKIDPAKFSDVPFLYDAVQEEINNLRNNFDKWQKLLNVTDVEEFDGRAIQLLASIALGKRSVIGEKERAIAAAPLNEEQITGFKQQMGAAWKAQTRIRRLFNYFGNIEDVSGQDIKLKLVGQNIFFEKAKIRFIDGEHHSQIYGMEQLGQNVGRWEDDLFLRTIENNNTTIIEGKSLLETLSACLQQLVNSGATPTMIFLEPQFLYKDDVFLSSSRYSQFYDPVLNPDDVNFFVLGTFDQIPIFTSYSQHLKNKVLVSDFGAAFTMLHKTNPDWYENELSVKVLLPSEEQIQEKYEKQPEKWKFTNEGIELSEHDAKTLIRTSIVIDIETIADFRVNDFQKFNIGYITEVIPD
ncbi:hypothetical protein MTO98_30325 [Mucilaginibacter sp. SMC90]|uniref:hypothetical protein n=1 Tax=Mucilaginibacter sp. SMC90 TaxID=2929803 RepID=UPI001FB1F201|nr:hypothetical protein [Mucilaginibacter sp. SMC90]UOE48699.1 hypothetical protein MTO98_30325 [Mucilaginibacter sp. SMC90]